MTGAHSDRRQLLKLDTLAPGDVTVTRIDRLARSTFDLFAIVKQIVDGKAQFRSLSADTGTSTGRLILAVLGALADVERAYPHPDRRGQKPRQDARAADGPTPGAYPTQQKEASRRRAEALRSTN